MREINLNHGWRLCQAPLHYGKAEYGKVMAKQEGWLECDLPSDVRMPLIKEGIIKNPVQADYCLESEWIEKRSWWFTKQLKLEPEQLEGDIVEFFAEAVDTDSEIFINGCYVGSHKSVHYPFVKDVKECLKTGDNEITIRVSTGLEKVTDEELSQLNWAVCREIDNGGKYRGDYRRAYVRRPAYTIGWDWGPRIVTCGITGDVLLKSYKKIALREVSVRTESIGDTAVLGVTANIENLDVIGTRNCELHTEVYYKGEFCSEKIEKDIFLTSGINYVDTKLEVKNPKLWWPNGYGKPELYEIKVYALCEEIKEEFPEIEFGIRTITLDTSVIQGEHRRFTLVVNQIPIFAKGGDWIPSDSIYARATKEKCHTLLKEAVEANFNMLRIWGGGLYEKDYFYHFCNQYGILLWHDFMMACATYPDHEEWFRNLMYTEMDYQTKRLRNHPCIGLFCGTNENHWIFNKYDNPKWNIDITYNKQYGLSIPNIMAKEIMRKNCSHIPFWNSSPYGGKLPNDDTVGDIHRWHDAFMSKNMEERIDLKSYDDVKAKFVSEYGYVGPCSIETMKECLDLKEKDTIVRKGRAWEMHNNVFEKDTVYAGIEKHYLDHAEKLTMEEYLLYGGMVQSIILEYSLEAIRFKDFCSGGIFWMYNDTWGEVGWTIMDYYLRRKISYYGVKRALAHKKVSVRVVNGNVVVQAMNDSEEALKFQVEFGYVSFDGRIREIRKVPICIGAHERKYVLEEKLWDRDYKKGSIMVIPDTEEIAPVMLRMDDVRNLEFSICPVRCVEEHSTENGKRVVLVSDGYAHGVYVKGSYKCTDNYFDMLPGQKKVIEILGCQDARIEISQVR